MSKTKTKRKFDCVEMKRKVQEQVYRETCNLSRAEELKYFRAAGREFWQELKKPRSSKGSK